MQWLNENFNDWHLRINLDTLDIRSRKTCVVGQLWGQIIPRRSLVDLGLDVRVGTKHEMEMEFWYLTTEWKRQITLKRLES